MKGKRARSAFQLSALLLLPLLAVFGLFGYGVHIGEQNRRAILDFEHDYLGWDVPQVEAPEAYKPAGEGAQPHAKSPQPGARGAPPAPAFTGGEQRSGKPGELDATGRAPDATGRAPDATGRAPDATGREPDAAGGEPALPAGALAIPVTVRLKVLVDERMASRDSGWMALTMRTVEAASRVYRHHFNIELSLSGAVRWDAALSGLDGRALLSALQAHPREGADVVLGFVDAELGREAYELALPAPGAPSNSSYALVGSSHDARPPHLPGLLRAIGHVMGAQTVEDPQSEAYRLGSFMRQGPLVHEASPWIDLDNRQRILTRKTRPFDAEQRP